MDVMDVMDVRANEGKSENSKLMPTKREEVACVYMCDGQSSLVQNSEMTRSYVCMRES
jgi:hypothetical protein